MGLGGDRISEKLKPDQHAAAVESQESGTRDTLERQGDDAKDYRQSLGLTDSLYMAMHAGRPERRPTARPGVRRPHANVVRRSHHPGADPPKDEYPMKPATKTLLQGRIREMHRRAMAEDETAAHEEASAQGRRVHANECREVAAELQALLDAAQPITMGIDLAAPGTDRSVVHVDADEPEAEGIPPHVWLYRNMLTDLQAVAPLGRDETNGQYAVAIDQLTDEQRAIPHVSRQLPGDVLTVVVDADVRIEENDIVRREV